MSVARRAFNNLFWISVSEVVSKGMTFLGTVYLARVLDKAGFGLFSLALAVGVYFWTAVDMGVTGYGVREVARDKERAKELYSLLNSLRLVLALTLFLIFCGALYAINIPAEKRLILLAGCFYVIGYSISPDWVFGGLEKMQYIAAGNIAAAASFILGVYFFVKGPSDVVSASLVYSFSFFIGSAILILILSRKLSIPFYFKISLSGWLHHIKESFYFAMNRGFANISLFIPIFFMGVWSRPEDLGLFSAPHRVTLLVARAGGLVISALYPVLSNLYAVDRDAFKKTQARFQKALIAVFMPVCVVATVFSKEIILFLYGASYSGSAGIFNILAWLSFILLLRYSFGNVLLSAGFHRFNMIATGAGVLVSVLVSIALIPRYSGYGAVWALISGELVTLIMMGELFRKKIYHLRLLKSYLFKILLAGALISLVLIKLNFALIPGIAIAIAVYGLILLSMGIVSIKKIQGIYSEVSRKRPSDMGAE